LKNNVANPARPGCRRPDRIETAYAQWLRDSPLHVLAKALGGLPDDARAFWCPNCQASIISGHRLATEWPSARLIVDLCRSRSDSREFVCDKCGLQGTQSRLARACVESPVIFDALFAKRPR
jgi:predicted RNA-binding Zn-ribbon protein involved in translation (DUF1610 family)